MADPQGHLAEFRFQANKDGKVFIYYTNRLIKILTGKAAGLFFEKARQADQPTIQMMMAKATGNFKRGNERLSQSHCEKEANHARSVSG